MLTFPIMCTNNTRPLLTSQFDYELPKRLIPSRPDRGGSRLLALGPEGDSQHLQFRSLPQLLSAGDLLVFNDTRVLRARVRGHRILEGQTQLRTFGASGTESETVGGNTVGGKIAGGAVEALLIEPVGEEDTMHAERTRQPGMATKHKTTSRWRAMLRPGKRQRPGQRLVLAGLETTVEAREGDIFELTFDASAEQVHAAMELNGELPLPPYLERRADQHDNKDYQTLFARAPGAVAAPTAGLHFDENLLAELTAHGIQQSAITLHVGPGTFRPVKTDDANQHVMDSERYWVPPETAAAIQRTKARGARVIAVGTTVTRTLEGAYLQNSQLTGRGRTDLFITPGHNFQIIDGLITNFHLPRSTLLMLVAALIGRQRTLSAYAEAVKAEYLFYSYGDAMLMWKAQLDG